jgi:6-pyruvoyltetrahydropterin/6-carboxytetrahydropterin synthase
MVFLTRREHFNAAHKLYNEAWNHEQNEAVFGKCANANWHGHNYEGFVINAKELSDIIKKYVCDKLDHKNLNLDVDFMRGQFTSTENLAKAIWQQLLPHIKGCQLHCVKVQETENIYVEYFGN